MSAKFSREELVDLLFSSVGRVSPDADQSIVEAVDKVYFWIKVNPSCSLQSKNLSLSKAIREEVDPIYLRYAKRVGLPAQSISSCLLQNYSKLLFDIHQCVAAARLFDPNRSNAEVDFNLPSKGFLGMTATVDVLKDFIFVCSKFTGKDVQVVEMSGNLISKKRGKTKSPSKADNIPIHRNVKDAENLCELCSSFTEQAEEILRVSAGAISGDDDALELVSSGHQIHTPGYSPRFCFLHSPQQNPSKYQVALEKKDYYHAMRRFLITCRQISHKDAGSVVLMRSLSFTVVNELDKSLYKTIPDIVDLHYDSEGDESSSNEIKNHLLKIQDYLQPRNIFLHGILFDLLISKEDLHDKVYEAAVGAEIIPKNVDNHLDFVFRSFANMLHSQIDGSKAPHPLQTKTKFESN